MHTILEYNIWVLSEEKAPRLLYREWRKRRRTVEPELKLFRAECPGKYYLLKRKRGSYRANAETEQNSKGG